MLFSTLPFRIGEGTQELNRHGSRDCSRLWLATEVPISLMQLLGLAELADGSLFFSFGGSDQKRSGAKTSASPRVQSETKVSGSTPPKRLPSSFRKHSPIPDSRKRATVSKDAAATAQPQGEEKTTQKAKSSSQPARSPRPSSSFSKRSPIPKDRGSVPASTSKKKSRASEDPPAAETPAKAAFDFEKDSPFSPELKEILSHGKETAGQQSKDNGKSKTETKTSSAAKKKSSKPASEETEVAETVENGAVSKDLGSFKLPELRSLAKARGLKGYSKLKKGELVDLLASSES